MPKAEKVGKVRELRERIEGSQALLLAEFQGLSVADATELRRSLSEAGARFAVVKNTLMARAAQEAGLAALQELLRGPTAVAFVTGDPVAAAKRVVEAARRFPALTLKGGWVEGRFLDAGQAERLATLESREVLLARAAGMLKAEVARAAYAFQAVQARFLAVLDAFREKLPAGPEAAAPSEGDAGDGGTAGEAAPAEEGPQVEGDDGKE
ncbi:MAG TPA: 50S ribosomal protein L10 [Actinomycetota bacterium]|nr:50S ribosomal protein L10 [Actinomycetota bacterium]